MIRSLRFLVGLGAVAGLTSGCLQLGLDGSGSSGSDSSGTGSKAGDDDEEDDDPEVEKGSCNAWKVSYCHAVDECGAFGDEKDCETDVGYVVCHEEAPYAKCQKDIESALKQNACKKLPDDCGPKDIADRREPTLACERIYEAICEWSFYCGTELSVESCLASLQASTPCGGFTAVLPGVDECIAAYRSLGCGDPSPDICYGILRY